MAALLCALAASSTSMPAGAASEPLAQRTSEMDILPSLKSHMSRLETLMHFLFRHFDDHHKVDEVITTVDKMIAHLEQVGNFTPDSVEMLIDEHEFAEAKQNFHACLERAKTNLRDLKDAVTRARETQSRAALRQLDQTRRDCHSAFA